MASIEERLEAIARNRELLSGMQLKTEEALNRLTDTVNTGFTKVARILVTHEERLDDLEERRQ